MSILGGLFKKDSGAKKQNAPQKTVIAPESGENSVKSAQKPIKVEKEEVIPVKAEIKEENEVWNKIIKILNVWETGDPNGKPDLISIFSDGRGGRKQVTLGVGFTEDGGNLKKVIQRYISKNGKYSNEFKGYVDYIGDPNKPSLVGNGRFLDLLKKAAKEDQLMVDSQREIFEEVYLASAKKFIKENGFKEPICWLTLADSALHSGSPAPSWLRKRFPEVPPSKGGNGIDWCRAYLKTRRSWLKGKGGILAKTTYRVDNIIDHLEKRDIWLKEPFYSNGVWVQ